MKRNLRKVMALVLAGAMLSGVSVFAADTNSAYDGSTGASGTMSGAGSVNTPPTADLINVVVPSSESTVFNFSLDPQKLAAQLPADGVKVDANASVLFSNVGTDGSTVTGMSGKSDKVSIISKSQLPVNIVLTANPGSDFGNTSGLVLTEDKEESFDATAPNVYLALSTDTLGEQSIGATGGAKINAMLNDSRKNFTLALKSPAPASGSLYEYKEKADLKDTDWDSINVYMSGACDTAADWSGVASKPAEDKVDIAWTFTSPAASAVDVVSTADKTLTLTGAVKPDSANNVEGTTTLTVKPLDCEKIVGVENAQALVLNIAEFATVMEVSANNALTLKKEAIAFLLETYGKGTIALSVPNAQGVVINVTG